MTKYVGLTDHPIIRKKQHGNPSDWKRIKFKNEKEARAWEKKMLAKSSHKGGPGGEGWRYGYIYTITKRTKQ